MDEPKESINQAEEETIQEEASLRRGSWMPKEKWDTRDSKF